MNHMIEVHDKYAPSSVPISASPRWATSRVGPPPRRCSASRATSRRRASTTAFKNLKNFSSDLWCKPWYFDSTVGKNVSNNTDITVTPQDGKMVQTEDCFEIAELPANPLAQIRAKEKELGLNS